MAENLILVAAAFLAGILNSIAGGGTFLTFPALVYVGVPPVVANATSTVAVFPGYASAAAGFRRELASLGRRDLVRIALIMLAGGLVGSLALLISSNRVFSAIVPFLLLIATITFAFQDRIRAWTQASGKSVKPQGALGALLVSTYGGYFNGGLGIILLSLFSLWGMRDMHTMNGLKSGMSFVISAISVATFAIASIIRWPEALMMALASVAGGFAGASLARVLGRRIVRIIVIITGLTMSTIFFLRIFW